MDEEATVELPRETLELISSWGRAMLEEPASLPEPPPFTTDHARFLRERGLVPPDVDDEQVQVLLALGLLVVEQRVRGVGDDTADES